MAESKRVEYDLVEVLQEWILNTKDGYGPAWSEPIVGQVLADYIDGDGYTDLAIQSVDGQLHGIFGAKLVTWRE